jgi:hypothetical protein
LRADLSWLLAASRGGEETTAPVRSATEEVLDVLRERGASFATDISTLAPPPATPRKRCRRAPHS